MKTDNEIKKALERMTYGGHSCMHCKDGITKGDDNCGLRGCKIGRNALDLINRLEKENNDLFLETEELIHKLECLLCHATDGRLSKHSYALKTMEAEVSDAMSREYNEGYNEAIKEFWKKFDEVLCQNIGPSRRLYWRILEAGNNLVAEMTEFPTKIEHSSLCETDTYEVKE